MSNIQSGWVKAWSIEKLTQTWDKKRADEVWHLDPAYQKVAEAVYSLGNSVIDIGCGGGMQYAAFQDFTPELAYRGIDIHPGMVDYARAAFPGVEFDQGDATQLPYEDDQFEVALLRHVLEHHPPVLARVVLTEATRVASNGLVILFFKPPHAGDDNRVRGRHVTVTHFSRQWLIAELNDVATLWHSNKLFIPKTPYARNNQELWTITLS